MASKIYRKRPKRKKERQTVNRERLRLYRKTQEQINQVNKRLEALAKGGYAGTWSSKKLLNRVLGTKVSGNVDVIKRRGKVTGIKLKGKITNTQLLAVHKASTQFLKSSTSTVSGIKEVRNKTISSLKNSLSDIDLELEEQDVEFLYDMLEVNEMQDIAESFGASRMWDISQDAIEANDSKEDFMARFEREIATLNDEDMKKKAEKIYDYISKKITK